MINTDLLLSIKQRVIDIEKTIDSIEHGVDLIERHQGDIQFIIEILSKDYGDYTGYEILENIIKEKSKKLNKKKRKNHEF